LGTGSGGAEQQDRDGAAPGRRLGHPAEPRAQSPAVAVPAKHQQIEAVLGRVGAHRPAGLPVLMAIVSTGPRSHKCPGKSGAGWL
jgi:hypothetical protein